MQDRLFVARDRDVVIDRTFCEDACMRAGNTEIRLIIDEVSIDSLIAHQSMIRLLCIPACNADHAWLYVSSHFDASRNVLPPNFCPPPAVVGSFFSASLSLSIFSTTSGSPLLRFKPPLSVCPCPPNLGLPSSSTFSFGSPLLRTGLTS